MYSALKSVVYLQPMETLKVDKTKLKTIKNYAEYKGVSVQAVYKMVRENRVYIEKIDGVTFVKV